MNTRNPLFDLVKGLAMYMVIYWHVMSYRPGFELLATPSYAANFIIIVNMPLFFMVSGYFSHRVHEMGDWRRFVNRIIKYFWPIAVFSVVIAVTECICTQNCLVSEIPVWVLKKFLFHNWFFYALAGCDIITFFAYKFGRQTMGICVFCSICFLACLLVSRIVWHTSNIVAMLPFYWFGLVLLPKVLRHRHVFVIFAVIGGVLMVVATYFLGNVAINGLGFYWDRFDIWNPEVDKIVHMISRYTIGVLGSLFLIYCVKGLIEKIPGVASLAFLGTETLGVYILQGNVIHYLSNQFVSLDAGSLMIFICGCGVFALSYGLVVVLKSNRWVKVCAFGRPIFLLKS